MSELAASLAHEINQPLTSILLNAQAATHLLSSHTAEAEELKAILQDIVDDDKRASEIIVRIRDLAGNQRAECKPVSVNEVVQQVAELVNKDLHLRQLSLGMELAPNLETVEGDRVQLQQVVMNLLLNAFEASSLSNPSPGKVTIRTEMSSNRSVHVVVCDNGPGVPKEMESKVFEPFYTTKKSGMGMGLSIARSIVELHGGTIWTNTNTGRGAEFHFSLPVMHTKSLKAGAGRGN